MPPVQQGNRRAMAVRNLKMVRVLRRADENQANYVLHVRAFYSTPEVFRRWRVHSRRHKDNFRRVLQSLRDEYPDTADGHGDGNDAANAGAVVPFLNNMFRTFFRKRLVASLKEPEKMDVADFCNSFWLSRDALPTELQGAGLEVKIARLKQLVEAFPENRKKYFKKNFIKDTAKDFHKIAVLFANSFRVPCLIPINFESEPAEQCPDIMYRFLFPFDQPLIVQPRKYVPITRSHFPYEGCIRLATWNLHLPTEGVVTDLKIKQIAHIILSYGIHIIVFQEMVDRDESQEILINMRSELNKMRADFNRRYASIHPGEWDYKPVGNIGKTFQHIEMHALLYRKDVLATGDVIANRLPPIRDGSRAASSYTLQIHGATHAEQPTILTLVSVHLAFTDGERLREEIEWCKTLFEQYKNQPISEHFILLGDFNTKPPHLGMQSDLEVFANDGLLKRCGEGEQTAMYFTSKSFEKTYDQIWVLERTYDALYVRDSHNIPAIVDLADRAMFQTNDGMFISDHLPVYVDLRLDPKR